jgi:hypothetical protein
MSRKFITKTLNKFKTKEKEKGSVDNDDNDVIIYIGEEPNFKEFYLSSKILRKESNYFKNILSNKNIEEKDGKYVIKQSNINPQVFDVIAK